MALYAVHITTIQNTQQFSEKYLRHPNPPGKQTDQFIQNILLGASIWLSRLRHLMCPISQWTGLTALLAVAPDSSFPPMQILESSQQWLHWRHELNSIPPSGEATAVSVISIPSHHSFFNSSVDFLICRIA